MDYLSLGDKIDYDTYNGLVYLLRKFKRLTSDLKISKTISSDYGDYTITGGLTSVGGNFILEDDVTISSTNVLRNCFYTFNFSVIDVNLSGIVNKRVVSVTGDTGDNGVLEVVLEPSLLESDEVLLPEFNVDIVFDPHEYYTPVSVLDITLESDKRFVGSGEVATVTATVLDAEGEPLEGLTLQFNVNGVLYSRVTDENGQAFYEYTGTGVSSRVEVSVSGESLTLYDGVMVATVSGNSVSLGREMVATGDILIDWGDGTTTTRQSGDEHYSTHNYTDGQSEHTIGFIGDITSLGYACFSSCYGLKSIIIPDTVTSLENYCFYNCTGLTSINIPNGVTSLGIGCFYNCTGLTSVTIPSSVTRIGVGLFRGCNALIDYQLYWKDTAIIEYNSNTMPVNSNTYFTIPQGQRNQYLSKHYPNKIKIRGYDLSVTTDKTVIMEDETSTVTATLTYNMEPISNKTVSYTIRQGATIIDTGSDTTDSNGQIEIEYTGTSTGKITIQVTYDDLTETTTIYDTIKYDNATTTDHNDIWTLSRGTITRTTEYSILTETSASMDAFTSIPNPCTIEFEINQRDGKTTGFFLNFYHTSKSNYRGGTGLNQLNRRIMEWMPVHIELDGATALVTDLSTGRTNTRNLNDSDTDLLSLFGGGDITELWFRNFRVYNSSGTGKVDTSISISSDKASYYTDESILLTGSLTDEDDLPLVGADVKLYRGASLLETVSTDSTGTYEKSVTGLSAGSYSFKAVYDGDDTYQGSTSSTVSVIVQNHAYSLSIASDKQSILTSESVTISGTLLKDSSAFTGQSVSLYDGSTLISTLTTDSDGEYEETLTGLSVGTHTFKAVNSNVESSTVSVTVTEPTPVHDYSLSVVSDKDILSYADSESATITATLTDNGVAVSGETLNYVIKHGSTTIDSGTDTTDSNGEISFTYTATGVGDVTIEVDYSTLLQETFVIQDCLKVITDFTTGWTTSGATSSYNGYTIPDNVEIVWAFDNNINKVRVGIGSGTGQYGTVYYHNPAIAQGISYYAMYYSGTQTLHSNKANLTTNDVLKLQLTGTTAKWLLNDTEFDNGTFSTSYRANVRIIDKSQYTTRYILIKAL